MQYVMLYSFYVDDQMLSSFPEVYLTRIELKTKQSGCPQLTLNLNTIDNYP